MSSQCYSFKAWRYGILLRHAPVYHTAKKSILTGNFHISTASMVSSPNAKHSYHFGITVVCQHHILAPIILTHKQLQLLKWLMKTNAILLKSKALNLVALKSSAHNTTYVDKLIHMKFSYLNPMNNNVSNISFSGMENAKGQIFI